MQSPQKLSLTVVADQEGSGDLVVSLSGEAFRSHLEGATPPPASTSLDGEIATYRWEVESWAEPVLIIFDYEAESWGLIEGEIGVVAGARRRGGISFTQFQFP